MKVKVVDSKILGLGIVFIAVVAYMTIASIGLMNKNTAVFISEMQTSDLIVQFDENLELLKSVSESLAENKIIIDIMQKANTYDYTQIDIQLLSDSLQSYYNILDDFSFVRSVSIINMQHNFIVSNEVFVTNYSIEERPWYYPEIFEEDEPIITEIYENVSTNSLTSSIVNFIVDPDTNQKIGIILINISPDDVFYRFQDEYRIADVNIFATYDGGHVALVDNKFITGDAANIDAYEKYAKQNVNIVNYKLLENFDVTMAIDLDSLNDNPYVVSNSNYVITKIILLTLSITIVIVICLIILLKPVFSAIGSLVHIIEELGEDYPEYNMQISKVAEMAKFVEHSLPKKIKYLIYYDELTGLPNRKMFKTLYRAFINTNQPFVIMLLDIKNFKGINDACGDEVGDQVLIDIGQKLTTALSNTEGAVIRYSGDEFIVLVQTNQIDNNIGEFFEKYILPEFDKPFVYEDKKPIAVEFNSVAVVNPTHCGTEEDMITKVYVMLKQCKELNTQRLFLFDNDVYSIYVNEERIKKSLKDAIKNEEFVVNYQPIVDANKQVQKAEALIRWFSKDLGFIPPNKFIYVAEQSRLIIDLGNWIIERVAKDLKTLQDEGRAVQISINISPIQIMEENFVPTIKGILDMYNIDYKYICFEITESLLIEERDIVKHNIKALQKLGIYLALDDFGTGYSSFSYLKEYNLDIIKIDKIFIDNTTEKDYAIIDGINHIAKALGMQMVLEGVETQEQFDNLKKNGLIQGYYFSRPVVWDEFIKLL
ncbi:MAG: hypothetical protein BEN19_03670 [Epulopiscium sp. Nuni2H_MBin003]|nr:MAG: hypothetical protein BEN19_03670 [Epulopiscium sp. Nuni2H_MBin003]